MKCIKMVSLTAIAVAVLSIPVGAGTALADEFTSPTGSTVKTGATVDWSLEPGTSLKVVDTSGKEIIKCSEATIKGKVTDEGGAGKAVKVGVETFDWVSCTFAFKTLKVAGLEVKGGSVKATGEFQTTYNTVFFGSCIYGVTAGTSLGTISTAGTFTVSATVERFPGSAFACPETTKWTSVYLATEPNPLHFDLS